jgi:hypothetical protein
MNEIFLLLQVLPTRMFTLILIDFDMKNFISFYNVRFSGLCGYAGAKVQWAIKENVRTLTGKK